MYIEINDDSLTKSQVYHVTEKQIRCFLGLYTLLVFWETQLFFKQSVSKSKGIIEYPIKIVNVT